MLKYYFKDQRKDEGLLESTEVGKILVTNSNRSGLVIDIFIKFPSAKIVHNLLSSDQMVLKA